MAKREAWLDAAKGVGILFVVLAHTAGAGPGAWDAIFAHGVLLFHMPLFFIISGYVYRPTARGELFWKKISSLAVPYVVFLLTLTLAVVARRILQGDPPARWEFKQMAINDILGGMYLLREFGVFWFVTCLFFTQIIYNEVAMWAKGPQTPKMISFVAVATSLAYIIAARWPMNFSLWAVSAVPFALTCYWFGNFVRVKDFSHVVTAGFLAAMAMGSFVAYQSGADFEFNMKYSIFGPPLLGLLIALGISSALLLAIRSLPPRSVLILPLVRLGEASLVIMFLHQFFHFSLRGMGVENEVLIVFVAVLAPYAIYLLLRRSTALAPWFLGMQGGLPGSLISRTRHAIDWAKSSSMPVKVAPRADHGSN